MSIRSAEELEGLRRAGRAVAVTLREVRRCVRPGITTGDLDQVAERTIARLGGRPAPRLLYGFPGAICVSVGDEAVHGIGRAIHEEPSVPSVFVPALRERLTEGLVITVEPVITAGRDGLRRVGRWTEATADRSLAAHVEHTIAITRGRPLVLTAG